MGLKFIYGRSGSGKSEYCIRQIKKRIEEGKNNKLILLVPEQFTFETENKLLQSIGEKSVLNAEVLSFKRMAYRVFNECGGITHERMKDAGKGMFIFKILNDLEKEMKVFSRSITKQGFIDVVEGAITEFKKYKITPEIIFETISNIEEEESELRDKLEDLKLIYSEFVNRVSNDFVDTDDELTMLAVKLNDCNMYDNAEIWVDEFTTFTPQQLSVLAGLLKRCKNISITFMSDGESTEISNNNIFNVTKVTEGKLLKVLEDNRIPFDGVINLNKDKSVKFKESEEIAHLERYFFCYPFKTFDKAVKNIRIYKGSNNYDEIQYVAEDILRLVRDKGYRFKDISVVCRNIEDYEKIATVIFDEYEIPHHIDKKKDALSNPLVILISAAFDIIDKNWQYESVFKYLKTGLTSIAREDIDILENYVLANGIKGKKWFMEWWDYPITPGFNNKELSTEDVQKLNNINEIKDAFREPLIDFAERMSEENSVRGKCKVLYDFIVNSKVLYNMEKSIKYFEDNNTLESAKEYSNVLDIFMNVLDEMVEILGKEEIDNSKFIKILNVGLGKAKMGTIPLLLDQVNIGDITRIKSREVKALYIVGVNDGVLPGAIKDEGILCDRDREILKEKGVLLASDTKTKAFEEQFLVYTALTIPKNYLMITYPLADFEGKALRPSIIIPRIKKIFRNLKEESEMFNVNKDKYNKVVAKTPTFNNLVQAIRRDYDHKEIEEYWNSVYSWYLSNDEWNDKLKNTTKALLYNNKLDDIAKEKIKMLYGKGDFDKLMFDVSRIEKYANCPFSYYVQYGLKAKDRKIYDFTAPDIGTFMHEVLDKFTKDIRSKNLSFRDLTKEQSREIISKVVEEEIKEKSLTILNSSNRYKYFTGRFKKILTKSVTVISEQMKRSDFNIFKNEFEFGSFKDSDAIKLKLNDGEEIFLTGRIDRIDTLELDGETYIRIIDYKTGNKEFDLNQLFYGLQIQLLVYLDAILKNSEQIINKSAVPGAILYFKIDDPILKSKVNIDDEEIDKKILEELKMNGLMLKEPKIVRSMDNTMEGKSIIIPAGFNKDGNFSKSSSVMTREDFEILREYVNKKMADLCENMIRGKIDIEPTKNKDFTYCKYCSYESICQFDTSIEGNKYKIIKNRNKDEAINSIYCELGIKDAKGGDGNGRNKMD